MEFRIGPVEANTRNASDIPAMVYDELKEFKGDLSRVKTQKQQLDALKDNSEHYLGAYDDTDRLIAFAKFNDWRLGDQIAFESFIKQIGYKLDRHKEEKQLLPGNPLGIFALTSYGALSYDERVAASELLLDRIIDLSEHREIRMARYALNATRDPAWWATTLRGFKGSGYGVVAGVVQELAIRPADYQPSVTD